MPRLIVATRNEGKLVEIRELLADPRIEVVGVTELPGVPEVEEDAPTFAGNAAKKAREVSAWCGLPALADDSGLEVDALDGAPGVHSARFAGVQGRGGSPGPAGRGAEGPLIDVANNHKLLELLQGVPGERRAARFRCAVAFADPKGRLGDELLTAEGACDGT